MPRAGPLPQRWEADPGVSLNPLSRLAELPGGKRVAACVYKRRPIMAIEQEFFSYG